MTIDADTFNVDAHFHGVKGLIRIADKIDTIQRDTKTLRYPLQIDLPGGGRENYESLFMTLVREVKEELGVAIVAHDILYAKRNTNLPNADHDTFFMVTHELSIDTDTIVFGEKGIMNIMMTEREFIEHKNAVIKQKKRIIEYLETLQSEFS